MGVGMLLHNIVIRLPDHSLTIASVLEFLDRLVDVGKIFLHRNVLLVGVQDSVVISFNENLAGLRTNGFKVPR